MSKISNSFRLLTLSLAAVTTSGFTNKTRSTDENSMAISADQQSNGTNKDVEITRRIRIALVDDEELSVNAQNVKIITLNGRVNLRGPVETREEKARVASIAKRVVGNSRSISNKLEIVK